MSNKRITLEVCDEPWLVFDWEAHCSNPCIKLERRRHQRLRHRRPKPCFVVGVKLLDLAIFQSIDLIGGECFPTDHQSVLARLGLPKRWQPAVRCVFAPVHPPLALCPLFSSRIHVVLPQAVFKAVAILAVEECDPARLLAQVCQDRVVFLGEDPDAYVGVAARERQL